MALKLKPLADRVVVEAAPAEEMSSGGIILPDTAQEKPQQGTVVAVGEGARDTSGNIVAPSVAVGDSVLLPEYGGTKLEMGDQELFLFRESELLGKFA